VRPAPGRAVTTTALLLLAACLAPTPFQPAARDGSDGYRVERLEQDHFRIRFAGNEATGPQQVATSLAYLAAEVTLRNGGDYYVVRNDKLERATIYDPLGLPPDYAPRCCLVLDRPGHEYEASAEIVIYKGKTPADDPAAYDARAVRDALASRIRRGRFGIY